MKKKILSDIFALALLITAGYGVSKSVNGNADLSLLVLSNVEALASETGGTPCGGPKNQFTGMCESKNTVNCKDNYGCR
jgi:hypothetical protein